MKTLIKKLGIAAAIATAGVFAVTPLAFASDHGDIEDSQVCAAPNESAGLINALNLLNGNVLSCDNVNIQVAILGANNNGD
jgi:hypothetical protein